MLGNQWVITCPCLLSVLKLHYFWNYSSWVTSKSRSISRVLNALCCANPSQIEAHYVIRNPQMDEKDWWIVLSIHIKQKYNTNSFYSVINQSDLHSIVWSDKNGLWSWTNGRNLITWYTLDEIGHHGTEVSSDVLEDLCIFVILSFQKHPG